MKTMKAVHICGNYDDSEKECYCMWWLRVRGGERQEGKRGEVKKRESGVPGCVPENVLYMIMLCISYIIEPI